MEEDLDIDFTTDPDWSEGEGVTMVEEKQWKTAGDASYWKPEKIGDALEGELLESFEGTYGTGYRIKVGEKIITIPSYKALIPRLSEVPIGSIVRVTFTGEDAPKIRGHRPTKLFEVLYREA
jgi:hypothetical protein